MKKLFTASQIIILLLGLLSFFLVLLPNTIKSTSDLVVRLRGGSRLQTRETEGITSSSGKIMAMLCQTGDGLCPSNCDFASDQDCPCIPWECTKWSNCRNSVQTRTCTQNNNCEERVTKPDESQTCDCLTIWQCSAWTECTNGVQTRNCLDKNNCGTEKLAEVKNCGAGYKTAEKEFIIDKLTTSAEFSAIWMTPGNPNDYFYFEITSPDGLVWDDTICQEATGYCYNIQNNIGRIIRTNSIRAINLFSPAPGHWLVKFTYPATLSNEPNLSVSYSSDLKFSYNYNQSSYTIGQPIIIKANLSIDDEMVAWDNVNVALFANIAHSEYTQPVTPMLVLGAASIPMNDVGGGYDETAKDGIYTGVYQDTSQAGSYCFTVGADGQNELAGEFQKRDYKCTYVGNGQSQNIPEPTPEP